nr:hypothetical protein [Tessaracoccus coleopterorum]
MLDDDASVTCLARGSAEVPVGARLVHADRALPGAYSALTGDWDHVVDLATDPAIVRPAVAALAARAGHWSYVSTVSVYRDHAEAGQDEGAALLEAGPQGYGEQKVASEEAVTEGLGSRALIVRPGLIVGPGIRATGSVTGPPASPAEAASWCRRRTGATPR